MKIRIEVQAGLAEDEVIIKCARISDGIRSIHQYILDQAEGAPKIVFYKGSHEYYFPLDDVLFFETDEDAVYAHTADNSFRIRYRLYELERMLPRNYIRVSKSTILNANWILSINRNLTASSLVEFRKSHKHVYVSRKYYNGLRERLQERSLK